MVTFKNEGCGSFYRKRSMEVPLSLAMWDDLQPGESKKRRRKARRSEQQKQVNSSGE
jgi:hypothetical protein